MSRLDNLKKLNNMVSSLLDTVEEMEKNIDLISIEDVNNLKKVALSLSDKADKELNKKEVK